MLREINRIEQRIRIEEATDVYPNSRNRDDFDKEMVIDNMNLPDLDAKSNSESEETVEMVEFDSNTASSMDLPLDETPKGGNSLQKRLSVLRCHLATLEKHRDEQTQEREIVFQRNEAIVQRCLSILSGARSKLEHYLKAVLRVFLDRRVDCRKIAKWLQPIASSRVRSLPANSTIFPSPSCSLSKSRRFSAFQKSRFLPFRAFHRRKARICR